MLTVHLAPYFEDAPVDEITAQRVERYMTDELAAGVAWGSVQNQVNLLHAVLKLAVREWMVGYNRSPRG